MTLQDLYDQLVPHFSPSNQKDLKTAVRVLATALECGTPQDCLFDQLNQPLSSLTQCVETYLLTKGKGRHTVRNTKNNLRRLFRLAEAQHLLSPVVSPPTLRFRDRDRGQRPGTPTAHAPWLRYKDWPADLQQAFEAFVFWATAPVVPGRPATLRKRPITLDNYRRGCEAYFGYLTHIRHLTTFSFDVLFDDMLLEAYVTWHVNDCHHRVTHVIHQFLNNMLALARQYRDLPDLRTKLLACKRDLGPAVPTYDKDDAWVSLTMLHHIGADLWPSRQPEDIQRTSRQSSSRIVGQWDAVRAGMSLMLRLWTYIPYRQRNMRTMQLETNLRQDDQGVWIITFAGEQLKVGRKGGRVNTFTLPFPPPLVPVLTEYLTIWHPLLCAKASQPFHVFLNEYGRPYPTGTLNGKTKSLVYRYTGRYFHPHIIRTVWAYEAIRNGADLFEVAYMLNDTIETVVANYAHLMKEGIAEKAYQRIEHQLSHNGQGK